MQSIWERMTGFFTPKGGAPEPHQAAEQPSMSPNGAVMLAEGSQQTQGEAVLSLFTPDGTVIANPGEEVLRSLLFETNWAETWGDDGMINYAWFRHTPTGGLLFDCVAGKPELFFFGREPYGFYFMYRDVDKREYVPDNGSASSETVSHGLGGNPCLFAVTGFVSPATALEIMAEFKLSGRLASSVQWVAAPPF